MNKETISMTKEETERLHIINNLIEKRLNGTEAAKQLNLSLRQVRRIKKSIIKDGSKGVVHGNRGKKGGRKKDSSEIMKLLNEKYHFFGPTLATEKLEEDHGIKTNKETVRQLMITEGLWKRKKRKQSEYFSFRERKESFGEMEQFDGSYHHWFIGINEEQCLLLAVDDARGAITKAKFDKSEGVVPVFSFWKEYIEDNGKPLSIYLDRFSTYKVNHKNAEDNKDLMTQFERSMQEIGTKLITANTPQAKGRIERMNQTLQDRLVKELWLRGITDIENANRFLKEEFIPKFNKKFAVKPKRASDLHKRNNHDLEEVFSIKKERSVGNDFVVRYENNYYQLEEVQPITVLKRSTVTVETRISGEVRIKQRGEYLNFFVLPEKPKKEMFIPLPALTRQKSEWKPSISHPWKAASFKRREAIINAG